MAKSIGPFGSENGKAWDDGVYDGIKKITIGLSDTDNSIQHIYFHYVKDDGLSVYSHVHGGDTNKDPIEVGLDYPNEYLISISGYHGNAPNKNVRSLTFKSNKKTYGPFGSQEGVPFSIASPGTKIVGFHGTSGSTVESIGAYVLATSGGSGTPGTDIPSSTVVGPFGGEGGATFDDGVHDAVKKIVVAVAEFGIGIQYVTFEYITNGVSTVSNRHGEDKAADISEIVLSYPDEYLVSITGYYDTIPGFSSANIQSLSFQTNKRAFGPYGEEAGTKFTLGTNDAKIVGFNGRAGGNLDALGAHVAPISGTPTPTPEGSGEVAGPFGGEGGVSFDDGVHDAVKKIALEVNDFGVGIEYVAFEYIKDGLSASPGGHGGGLTGNTEIKLDYPDEFLVKVIGYHETITGFSTSTIQSLFFKTNKRDFGPYGEEVGTQFVLGKENYGIVGFTGRAGMYVDAIGAHLSPISNK